jgi:hypothetical protein
VLFGGLALKGGVFDGCATSPAPMNSLAPRRCPFDLAEPGGSCVKLDLVGLGVFCVSLPPGLKLYAGNAAAVLEGRLDVF